MWMASFLVGGEHVWRGTCVCAISRKILVVWVEKYNAEVCRETPPLGCSRMSQLFLLLIFQLPRIIWPLWMTHKSAIKENYAFTCYILPISGQIPDPLQKSTFLFYVLSSACPPPILLSSFAFLSTRVPSNEITQPIISMQMALRLRQRIFRQLRLGTFNHPRRKS